MKKRKKYDEDFHISSKVGSQREYVLYFDFIVKPMIWNVHMPTINTFTANILQCFIQVEEKRTSKSKIHILAKL